MRYAYENACWPDRLLLPHTYYCTHLWPFYCHFICIFSISKIRNICHSFSINYHSRIQLVTRPLTVCERASMRVTLSVSVVFHWFSFSTFRYSGASIAGMSFVSFIMVHSTARNFECFMTHFKLKSAAHAVSTKFAYIHRFIYIHTHILVCIYN